MSIVTSSKTVIDLHRDRGTVGFYLLSITLRILVESWFLYILLFWNLPALNNGPYKCSTDICSELRVCVVREKYVSLCFDFHFRHDYCLLCPILYVFKFSLSLPLLNIDTA